MRRMKPFATYWVSKLFRQRVDLKIHDVLQSIGVDGRFDFNEHWNLISETVM